MNEGDDVGAGRAAGPGPEVGTLAEEAERLATAVAGWARDHSTGLADGLEEATGQLGDALRRAGDQAPGGPECRWCPVCRGAAAARNLNPEVKTHLLVALTSLVNAAAAALETSTPAPGAARQPVEHIDLDTQEWEDE